MNKWCTSSSLHLFHKWYLPPLSMAVLPQAQPTIPVIIWKLPMYCIFQIAPFESKNSLFGIMSCIKRCGYRWLQCSSKLMCNTFFATFQSIFDVKMTKMKYNHIMNLNVNFIGIVCKCIHYFISKQRLALNLAFKSNMDKQTINACWTCWMVSYLQLFHISHCWEESKYIINTIPHVLGLFLTACLWLIRVTVYVQLTGSWKYCHPNQLDTSSGSSLTHTALFIYYGC